MTNKTHLFFLAHTIRLAHHLSRCTLYLFLVFEKKTKKRMPLHRGDFRLFGFLKKFVNFSIVDKFRFSNTRNSFARKFVNFPKVDKFRFSNTRKFVNFPKVDKFRFSNTRKFVNFPKVDKFRFSNTRNSFARKFVNFPKVDKFRLSNTRKFVNFQKLTNLGSQMRENLSTFHKLTNKRTTHNCLRFINPEKQIMNCNHQIPTKYNP